MIKDALNTYKKFFSNLYARFTVDWGLAEKWAKIDAQGTEYSRDVGRRSSLANLHPRVHDRYNELFKYQCELADADKW